MSGIYGGVDLGGTKIYSVVATADGEVLGEDLCQTLADQGYEVTIQRIATSLRSAAEAAGTDVADLKRVAVAAPGPIDLTTGVVTAAPNLGWIDVPLKRLLEASLGVEVVLENDANAAALGEFQYGAAKPYRHMVYITISTGIGGGLVLDGRLYTGASGAAGEIGHITVEPDGIPCFCAGRGCLEIMASGTAIARDATTAAKEGRSPALAKVIQEKGSASAGDVAAAALAGDPAANEILGRAARYIGIGLGSLINLINPEAIVIGGGVSQIGERLLGPAKEEARRRSFPQSWRDCTILTAALGSRVGALGAIAVAVAADQA
ncbi:MAG: ROK family protein [Dehalococcoidia bacterium]